MRMKTPIVLILLVGSFVAGVYVGRLPLADLVLGSRLVPSVQQELTQESSQEKKVVSVEAQETSYQIPANQLSAAQRELLAKLGINIDALIITPTMIACAEAKVGAARLAEIQAGATPTFSEGASLVACYR